ncbi:MAG TPA: ABC transporter permease [Anaerohalosphaeraceae bacterium]|mgnify:CR=1 FL=1|nr:ABC transporter permease [Phycisphaerae bacterium]HOK95531.1 ABC transporter permease [Anaerohalosphaeraceae bacterium]HOL30617.1 ABC transporter permease [Anaerohalosphaeraceae bacterium]HOM75282.1 ABC transporter permease [Anaerohalosphaeraceae bacterium]HPC63118.1 ABC transporter permease [Anaerohalosphaeraceae bacterium]
MISEILALLQISLRSLWMHRLRSGLTTLGIVFGVASVIAMLAIGEGASREAQEQISRLGSTNIILKTVKPPDIEVADASQQTIREYGLRYDDAERFRDTIPDAQVVVPVRRLPQQTQYLNRRITAEAVGTVAWYPELAPIEVRRGRFLTPIDMHYSQAVCVIDETVQELLFRYDDPIGQELKIAGEYYTVVGIVKDTSAKAEEPAAVSRTSQGGGVSGYVYIPLATMKSRFGETQIQFGGTSGASGERIELSEITIKVPSMERVLPTRDVLASLLEQYHKKKDYQIIVPLELLREAARTKRIFSIVLGSIAAISLLVGGIGIMNIMLATVSERTREIGIRRALGARKKDIVIQFLSETILLTLIGGLLGMFVGTCIPILVTIFSNMPTVITLQALLLSFGISAGIGLTFGLYPAYQAANMDPIESLRHE